MKNLKKLGKQLSKTEQKEVFGGNATKIIDDGARVYCRCLGGIGGEGYWDNCGQCASACALTQQGFICA